MRRIMLFFIISILASSFSQVPTLDPAKTVNLSTGEMGFQLPLGIVQGKNGHDFPINLYYQAGIRTDQQASPVGLGFSYGGGGIIRKVVFVNDDNTANVYQEKINNPWNFADGGLGVAQDILRVLTLCSFTLTPIGGIAGVIIAAVSMVISVASAEVNRIIMEANDFIAGGTHSPKYNFTSGQGIGFFQGGDSYDLPDIYLVNTPFIQGQLVWVGTASAGYFAFKQTSGSSTVDKKTIKVDYNKSSHVFTIILNDGTKLVFGQTIEQRYWQGNYYSKYGNSTSSGIQFDVKQNYNSPVFWALTKVLFPDYVDGDGDSDPKTNPDLDKGSWIRFHYLKNNRAKAASLPNTVQTGPFTAVEFTNGYPYDTLTGACLLSELYLDSIATPNQKALFDYNESGRKDDLYFDQTQLDWYVWQANREPRANGMFLKNNPSGVAQPFARRLLTNVRILNKNNDLCRKISFSQDYSLAPNSLNSCLIPMENAPPENPFAGRLTLNRISIDNISSKNPCSPQIVSFEYGNNPDGMPADPSNYFYFINALQYTSDQYFQVWPECKDYWGYYCAPISLTYNDFNADGLASRANMADAWSLQKVRLPSGMSIQWEYEPHRYDRANGKVVKTEGSTPIAKFGGGIRVKQMTVYNGINKSYIQSYFYTNQPGVFVENTTASGNVTNSSGFASVEPYPYLLQTDPRPVSSRGDLYTPAKVAYEMVQVVNGPIVNGVAKNGYTVYRYTHDGDSTVSGYFPNGGRYGQQDESWKRGITLSVEAYNTNNKLISKQTTIYEIISHSQSYPVVPSYQVLISYGCVRPTQITNSLDGVTSTKKIKYATSVISGQDGVMENRSIGPTQVPNPFLGISLPGATLVALYHYTTTTALFNGAGIDRAGIGSFVFGVGSPPTWTYYRQLYLYIVADLENGYKCVNPVCVQVLPAEVAVGGTKFTVQKIAICNVSGGSQPEICIQTDVRTIVLNDVSVDGNGTAHWASKNDPGSTALFTSYLQAVTSQTVSATDPELVIDEQVPFVADYDGQPNQIIEINSDGKQRVTTPIPAYWQPSYAAMEATYHMLTPTCQNIVYEKAAGDNTDPQTSEVRNSAATTYSNTLGCNAFVPYQSFIWNADMDANGVPMSSYSDFNFSTSSGNKWDCTGTVNLYSSYGCPLQITKPNGVSNSSIYGTQAALPIASISNATFFESGAFTCDYDLNENGWPFNYFDKQNGWEKDAGSIVTGMPHYGQKSLKILNGQGVMRCFKVRPNQNYELTGWVNVANGSQPLQVWVEYWTGPNPVTTWPIQWNQLTSQLSAFITPVSPTNGNWQLVDIRIPPRSETNLWIRIHFGQAGQSVTAYADDIRFGPANSLITTTYYDTLFREMPILKVDENSDPGKLITYDGFDRPFRVYKIEKTKTRGTPGAEYLTQRKNYYLMGPQ